MNFLPGRKKLVAVFVNLQGFNMKSKTLDWTNIGRLIPKIVGLFFTETSFFFSGFNIFKITNDCAALVEALYSPLLSHSL